MKMHTKQQNVTICFGGDVMLGRTVNDIMQQKGTSYPWGNLINIFKNADCTLVNLETTLTTHTKKEPKVFNFQSLPVHVQSLKDAYITAVTLANNHSKDFGNEGLIETITTLDKAHIHHAGAGKNILEAKKPVIIKPANNMTIGILGYTDNEPDWQATSKNPGINYIKIDPNNMEDIISDIESLRLQVDILIVSLHWGPNMLEFPLQEHIAFAHALVDHGVDIIHGHSAHILQGIEFYRGKLILYDTGDLVDDYAVDSSLRNDLSAIFQVSCSKRNVQSKEKGPIEMVLKVIPVKIENMQTNTCTGETRQMVFDLLNKRSAQFKTFISDAGLLCSGKI
ncbi:MAG TPA: CapA family protein [Patescibacteria group bacterium]|jgi:poly-gamma-glutamate synthesis protein (capsule biosynthesis protein)|nr:CapA family protein [Patescibacteria group bacterium]